MNSSEQTTVATLAVFFALIFLLIMITMCCILRRGCRKETTQEGHKRYRFRSDWDKSGTITSSETRITEAVPGATDNSNSQAAAGSERGPAGALLRIEEESIADTSKIESTTHDHENGKDSTGNTTLTKQFLELSCENDEHKRLIDAETTTCSFSTGFNLKLSNSSASRGEDDSHLTAIEDSTEFPSNCSVGEKEMIIVE